MLNAAERYPKTEPRDRRSWRTWLQRHHDRERGVWLIYQKPSSGMRSVRYAEAVEEALCFGWIDSVIRKHDENRLIQLFTPRRKGSTWSAINKRRIRGLMASGAMAPRGLKLIREAKRDGSWTLLDSVERLEVPPDLKRALKARPAAGATFQALSVSAKKPILFMLVSAKRPETRQARLRKIVDALRRGRNPFQRNTPS